MIEITRWPVVIVAAPRTGSNVLTDTLAKKYSAKCFYEPGKDQSRLDELVEYRQGTDTRYIAKIFLAQELGKDLYKELLHDNSFKIKLTRENEFNQIVSFYIAEAREVWDETRRLPEKYILPISSHRIEYAIKRIQQNNRMLDEVEANFDVELTYESMGYVDNDEFSLTVLPINIDKIRDSIAQVYNAR